MYDSYTSYYDGEGGNKLSRMINLNVSGTRFNIPPDILQRHPNTTLWRVWKYPEDYPDIYNEAEDEFFFDRNHKLIYDLINFYKTGVMHLPINMCSEVIKDELDYWGVPEAAIATCCWTAYNQKFVDIDMTYTIRGLLEEVRLSNAYEPQTLREKIRLVIENPFRSTGTKIWNALYLMIVTLAIVNVAFTYHPFYRNIALMRNGTPYNVSIEQDPVEFYTHSSPMDAFIYMDMFCLVVFFLEVVLRLATSTHRLRLLKSPMFILDIVLVLSYVTLAMEKFSGDILTGWFFDLIQMIIPLRALKVFHFVQRMAVSKIFQQSIRRNSRELVIVAVTTITTIIVFGTIVFCVERLFNTKCLKTLPDAMWWSLATVTTVGYGDVYPESAVGRLIAAVALVFGGILVTIPSAVILFNFSRTDAIVYALMKRFILQRHNE